MALWQIELRFAAREASMATTDAANVRGHVEQIRVALRGVANITRSIGEGRTALRNIEAESESFRRVIQDALLAIEAALR
jgi:CO/xanthine dehydrogenase FAD-binding subunit